MDIEDRDNLQGEIGNLDSWSIVAQFAYGGVHYLPPGARGTYVYIRRDWHQEPHFTVELRILFDW